MTLKLGVDIILPEEQSHYLKNVLRRDVGNTIRLFNQEDGEWLGSITTVQKKHIIIHIERQIRPIEERKQDIHLLFSPLKKERMDMLIEKSVELGVTHLHPVLFARSIVREIKPERVKAQIIEAAEQCERLSIPHLTPLKEFKKVLNEWNTDIPLFAAIERTDAIKLSDVTPKSDKMALCIGPEGGISDEESNFLLSHKFITPVSLGKNILRAETAVFYGLSVLSARL